MTRSVDPAFATLSDAAGAVGAGAAEIERAYLRVGDVLGRALDVVSGLTARAEGIPAELTGARMNGASEALWRLASEMSAVVDALPVEREALEGISKSLETLRIPVERLVTSIRTLVVLARGSRVEAANLSGNQYNFVEFAAEISVLAEKARDTIGAYMRDFSLLARLVASARESQSRFVGERRDVIKRSVDELQAAFDLIEDRQRAALSTSTQVAERSRQISDVVGEAIMALQAGDSTRQRLEHVMEGLEAVEPDAEVETAQATARLQAAQLDQALGDFDTAAASALASIGTLGREAGEIVDRGRKLVQTGGDGASLHETLRASLSSAGTLIHECEIARSSVDEVMGGLASTLGAFRERLAALNAITASVTSVGLNAAIKSARLGQGGRALAVIAEDLQHYAGRIVDDTKLLIQVFDDVLSASQALDTARSRQDGSRMAQADAEIGSLLTALVANEGVLSTAVKAITDAGSQLVHCHADAEAEFARLDVILEPARSAASALEALGREAPADAAPALPAGRRYSMESERRIHSALAG